LVKRCRSINDIVNGSRPGNGADGSEEVLEFSDEINFDVGELRFFDDEDDEDKDKVDDEEDDEEEGTVGGGTGDDNDSER